VSMISVFEIGYFFTIRLWFNLRSGVIQSEELPQIDESKTRGFRAFLGKLVEDFSNRTTIQGINYVADGHLSLVERVWWAVVVVISSFCCGSLIFDVYNQYDQSPVIISYANEEKPISEVLKPGQIWWCSQARVYFQIPFPAITVCPQFVTEEISRIYFDLKVYQMSLYDLDPDRCHSLAIVHGMNDPSLTF